MPPYSQLPPLLLLLLLLLLPLLIGGAPAAAAVDAKAFARCQRSVRRSLEWLDRDGDGVVSDAEVRRSETQSGVGYIGLLQETDETDLAEGCYHLSRMSAEDVQMYLSRCTKNDMFLAHFAGVDGAELFGRLLGEPEVSERAMHDMLIPARDRVKLRRILFKQLLKADRARILARELRARELAPRVADVRATQLTVHLPQNPGARGYKVQYCQENDGKAAGANVDVCGFAWSAVYPTAGVATVYLYGLLPDHSYQIRVRSFYCDAAGVVSKTVTAVTTGVDAVPESKSKSPSATAATAAAASSAASSASRWARLRDRIRAHPPKLRRVSASRDTVLLSWDGGCRIDSNILQTTMASVFEAPTPQNADGGAAASEKNLLDADSAAAEQVMHAQVCLAGSSVLDAVSVSPISWEVLYKRDEFGWSGGWETAGCAEARRVDNMNDGPFTCFVKDLKEGRRYQFKVRGVFNNVSHVVGTSTSSRAPGAAAEDMTTASTKASALSIEVESDVKRHMTGCDDDADCYGEKVCTPSFKCVKPYFSWTNLVYIIAGLAVMAMVLYACLVPGGLGSKNAFRVLKLRQKGSSSSSISSDDQSNDGYWFTQFKGRKTNKMGESLPMDSLDQHTQHRWINNKVVCEHFPFDMYQNQFLISIRDEMFSVEKWLGGGSFGRVFLARPVSNRHVGTLAAWVKQRFSKKSLKWSPTGGRCFAIKFLDKATGAHDIEMINKRFPYHENVSRPRFWLSSGWSTGRDLHVAPTNPFFIVPYLPLGDLSQYIPKNKANRKPLPPRFVRRIAHQALKGLEHMHRHGFIHLDIKPANLMLSSEGILKIVDFGEIETFQTKANSGSSFYKSGGGGSGSSTSSSSAGSSNATDGDRQLDSKYTDFVRHKTYDSGLRGTTLFHAPELSAPLTCRTVMKRGKEVKELFTKHDRGGMRFAYSKQWKFEKNSRTGQMEETGELEDTTCGFNSKVDIYALGISLLSMACGFQLLVKEKATAQDAKQGEVGHDGDRLRCCELLGSLVYDDDTGELLVDGINFERLGRCVPPEYRHWVRDGNSARTMGDGDFVKFIASMVCNVGKRKSALELLRKKSKQNQRSWLRSDAAEVSAGASPVVGGGGGDRDIAARTSGGASPRYPKEEASDEEFCRNLLEHATDPEFVEDALKYFPTYLYNKDAERWVPQTGSGAPTVHAYSGTMAGNVCGNQGYRPAQVQKMYDILHVELQRVEAEEIVRRAKLQNIVAHDMAKFLLEAWPDVAADASEKDQQKAAKYNAAGLRKVVFEYCEAENIIHAAQLDLTSVAQLCLAFYSGKRHRTFREKYAGAMLTKFREQLQSQFERICSQQVHRYGYNITAERVTPPTLRAQWVKSPKCGWVWMRKMGTAGRGSGNERSVSGQATLRHRASSYPVSGQFADGEKADDTDVAGREPSLSRSDSVDCVPKAPLAEHVTPDMFKWHKLFMVLQDGCLSCYRTIVDSVLEMEQVSLEFGRGVALRRLEIVL
jgi:serine/threonine protein kinase